jgi:hypothetical protein
MQVALILDFPPSPASTGEVHAMSVAGTRQVHQRSAGSGPIGHDPAYTGRAVEVGVPATRGEMTV